MNDLSGHPAFEELRRVHLKSLDIDVREYRHAATGALHIHLAADKPENVFLVGLRTVPEDSTGVAHILEHTVLCGSERFPVRDPFFMMIRRSLNTFMNAFTSTDWTAYPFATQNRKDYFNLLDVYLDAVFFSRLHELDFSQEGHRLEFDRPEDPDTDLVFRGVVYNEMKGAMSSPTSTLWQTLGKYLYPDTTYQYNSGGDPEVIPDLTYDQLVSFYRTHYHPSNAVFMTYGDIPVAELQTRFEERVLSRFEPLGRTIEPRPARRHHAPIRVEEAYATSESEDGDRTHLVLGWLLGESTDLDQRLEAHLLSSVLLDNSASPLMQALEQTDLGSSPSPLCGLDDSNLEMAFVCGVEGSRPERDDAVEKLIMDTLARVADEGVPQADVEAVLHQLELSQREIRGDGMPFGLQLVLSGLGAAMQHGDPLAAIDLDPALERLREKVADRDFIPRLVQTLLLDNPHRIRLALRPDNALSERRNAAEIARLAKTRRSLDEAAARRLVERAQALAERQAMIDDPDVLPKVGLDDVPDELVIPEADSREISGAPAQLYAQGTNGLVYQQLAVELPALDAELAEVLPLYTGFVTELGSGGRDYLDTQKRQAEVTGGLSAYTLQRGQVDDEQLTRAYFVLRGKALQRNADALAELLAETFANPRFDEAARIRELVSQSRAAREQSVTGSGHVLAMTAAASGMSPSARQSHRLSGLQGIRALKVLDDDLANDDARRELQRRFEALHERLSSAPQRFLVIAEADDLDGVSASLADRFPHAGTTGDHTGMRPESIREQVAEAWLTSTEVNFCAAAFPTVPSAHDDAAALTVLGPLLRNGFLHRAIRETGGAYGGGASQDSDNACFRFFSYRDPRLEETLDDFHRAVDWFVETDHEFAILEEAILNVVSSIDKPGSPAGEARSAFQAELFGRTAEHRRAFRRRVLDVSLDDVKRVAQTYLGDRARASTAVISSERRASQEDIERLGLTREIL